MKTSLNRIEHALARAIVSDPRTAISDAPQAAEKISLRGFCVPGPWLMGKEPQNFPENRRASAPGNSEAASRVMFFITLLAMKSIQGTPCRMYGTAVPTRTI